jgi:hypothetical protein
MTNIDVKAERELNEAKLERVATEGAQEIAAAQLDLICGGNPTSIGAAAGSAVGHAGQDMLWAASSAGDKISGGNNPPLAPNPYE